MDDADDEKKIVRDKTITVTTLLLFIVEVLQSAHWHEWNGLSINSLLRQHVTHED